MEPVDVYIASRNRMIGLVPTLAEAQLSAPLAATPPWVLVDAYRHLTGVCADVLDGQLENAGSPDWTATQLEQRAASSLAEVCDEWSRRAPDLDERVAQAGRSMSFVAFDTWTHEQDVRAAAGLAGARDEVADSLALIALDTFARQYAKSGAPTLLVDVGQRVVLGDSAGEPVITLTTSPYELLRMIFGRRSRSQMEAAGWTGASADRDRAIDALHLFDLPTVDIVD